MNQRPLHSAAELLRLIHNLVRLGTIAEVDHNSARVRVAMGELATGWLAWIDGRAGTTRTWNPPTVGEQVVVFSPGGDLSAAVVLTGLYRAQYPAPSASADVFRAVMPDGAVLEYDHAANHLRASLPGSAEISAAAGVTLNADAVINGNVAINGDSLTHNGKNVGDTHRHSGITSGPSNTGEPV
ncbi:phage baseplate assembly protein V [Halomonas urumqiensis]|uniref:Phage baseplate assembly protein V n=1 Tax=Halomonas urumqiensis TaxID=1684789 RepID=A0A2N7UDR3_9GAMM|nr:phage baseplate assembly protein V [Halomonas urumqiensis]PMR78531.1 phage baseplate assembly protein V [Halomonas urumqiensis]PTB03676.1 phage baseplate assembly protein V [Halomonas urumqiensis]GHE20111.1 baseplate assembly protein [Halomonas urumqiensis]